MVFPQFSAEMKQLLVHMHSRSLCEQGQTWGVSQEGMVPCLSEREGKN